MFYQEAINYIKNIERAGSNYGIERMRELLILLGEPDKQLKFVHIAGTNGKGSVSAYLTSILKESGYRVGTYNSPSVFCYNERWLIDGKMIDDDDVAKYLSIVKTAIENEQKLRDAFGLDKFQPTAFEIETAVAFLAFCDKECEICVLETGLGGRWDATNVIEDKEIAIITPIGLDHCQILGSTLNEIANEKSAIIHNRAVTCEQCDEIMQAIYHPYHIVDDKEVSVNADVYVCNKAKILSSTLSGQRFEYDNKTFEIAMLGEHQVENASIAICAVEQLRKRGWDIGDEALCAGLKNAVWHARFEIVKNAKEAFDIDIPQDKTLVFDGSHNPHGARTLAKCAEKYFKNKRIYFVIGMLKDKDVNGVLDILMPLAWKVGCITPNSNRAMQKEELASMVTSRNVECDMFMSAREGIVDACKSCADVVILCGSLTLFAQI